MRFRLAAPAVVAAAALALLGAGCSSTPAAPASVASATIPTLTIGTTFPEPNLDETKNNYAHLITSLGLEKLMQIGPQGQLEPDLAASMTQASPVTYVFHLRHGVKFWDGNPLTAADVAYSLNYERSPGSAAGSFYFSSVKNVTADGPYTVNVTMSHPDPSFPYSMAAGGHIFEKSFAEKHPGTFGNPGVLVMGSGPWEIDSLEPTKGAELSANPHWWGGKVPIQHISFKFYANDTTAALAFRAGEIDFDPFIDGPKSFAAASGAKILAAPSDCTDAMLSMNTQAAPWNDVHVRRAVAYALDRTDIINAEGGYATPYYTFIPPGLLQQVATAAQVNGLVKSLPLYQYDLAKARQELAQSAYPHGFTAPVVVFVYGNVVTTAEAIAGELQKIGINMQVKAVTLADWGTQVSGPASKRPTTYFTSGCTTDYVSGYDYFLGTQNLQAGQYNVADWAPPQVDGLLNQVLSSSSSAGRFAAYSQLLQKIAADVPYVPLFLHDYSVALSSKFTLPGYNQYTIQNGGAYALGIKASA